MITTDSEAWQAADPRDRWVFNKLELALRLGQVAGPVGVDLPSLNNRYVIRPIYNICGMGKGVQVVEPQSLSTDHFPPGHFWQRYYEGDHVTFDIEGGLITRVVEGITDDNKPGRFKRWIKRPLWTIDTSLPAKISNSLVGDYPCINVEIIGGNVIELHLRPNMDFYHRRKYSELLVVHNDDKVLDLLKETVDDGWTYEPDADGDRIGFFCK